MKWGRNNEMIQAAKMLRDIQVHYRADNGSRNRNVACFNGSAHVHVTNDPKKVTCKACLDAMGRK